MLSKIDVCSKIYRKLNSSLPVKRVSIIIYNEVSVVHKLFCFVYPADSTKPNIILILFSDIKPVESAFLETVYRNCSSPAYPSTPLEKNSIEVPVCFPEGAFFLGYRIQRLILIKAELVREASFNFLNKFRFKKISSYYFP